MWRSFFCALVAGVVLRFVNPFGSDQVIKKNLLNLFLSNSDFFISR
jgi:hypothetical protein